MSYASALYQGNVMHHRYRPQRHRFNYRVTSWLIDLAELPQLDKNLRLFSLNRFNLFSFHNQDHGDGSEYPLLQQVRAHLCKAQIDCGNGAVKLLCYPRILGYVFNPLSVYFCYNEAGQLKALIYEVRNTFKQMHSYLIPVDPEQESALIRQSCPKNFYVSPFMPMVPYQFRIRAPEQQVSVAIHQRDEQGVLFNAVFSGEKAEISDKSLLSTWLRFPLMTFKVIAGIHWEALQVWRKKTPLYPRPAPPVSAMTILHTVLRESSDEA